MKLGFPTLIVAAAASWGWVAYRIAQVYWSPSTTSESSRTERELEPALRSAHRLHRQENIPLARDAFQSSLYAEAPKLAPVASGDSKPAKKAFQIAEPPPFQIKGILMGAEPMIIVQAGSSTEFVKLGQTYLEYKVEIIEANRVVVQKQGRRYTLTYP
jgi:type II secretory pathway component PulC